MNRFFKKHWQMALAATMTVAAIAVIGVAAMAHYSQKSFVSPAHAQVIGAVPQFGIDIGDYGACDHNYNEGGVPNDGPVGGLYPNNFWTPANGGDSGYIGVYYHGDGSGYGAGDCVQAGIQNPAGAVYNEDFRIGIRATDDAECADANFSPWQYTPWASAAGGESPTVSQNLFDGQLRCIQLRVQTSTLPQGATIDANNLYFMISAGRSSPGYLDYADAENSCSFSYYNPNNGGAPSGVCTMTNVTYGGSYFDTIGVSLYNSQLVNAQETANNIPTTFAASQSVSTGTNGNPLSMAIKNTGSESWTLSFATKYTGAPVGTCGYAFSDPNEADAPPSGSPTSSCSVPVTLTSTNYLLAHSASLFSVSPEKIPIVYSGVTKTTHYTPKYTETIKVPCIALPTRTPSLIPMCPVTGEVPEQWYVSYSGGGYVKYIGSEQSATFPMSSIIPPAATGTYTETWQMEDNNSPFGVPFSMNIQVGSSSLPSYSNTLVVNANVPSTWIVSGPNGPLPQDPTIPTTSVTVAGLPAGNYTITAISDTNGNTVSLRNSKGGNVAISSGKGNLMSGFLTMMREPIASAYADTPTTANETTTGMLNGSVFESIPHGGGSITFADGRNNTGEFDIDWGYSNGTNPVGSPLSATLTANPTSGTAPLNVTLTATAVNSSGGTLNYLFWSNCSYSGNDVAEATSTCGDPFHEDDATTTLTDSAVTTYSASGTFTPLVIVEAGAGAPATVSAEASTSIGVNNPTCTSGDTQACTAATGNYCGMTTPGTETCGANGTWGTCAPPPDSACGYACVSGACQISSSSGGESQSDCESACVVPTPVTIIYFNASPGLIPPGGLTVLSWQAENANTCSITDQNGNQIYSPGNVSSSITVYPSSTTDYTLTCSNSSGSGSAASASTEQTVTVSSAGIKEGN